MNFDARAMYKRPKMPQHLNLKLAFIGYAFAGKKTQATLLSEFYGLQTYQLNDLVSEVLTYYEGHPEPIPAKNSSPSSEENSGENEEPLSEDSEIDQEFNAEEDFRICGEKIAALLKDGQEITDEIYVQLYVAKLRLTNPHKSKK